MNKIRGILDMLQTNEKWPPPKNKEAFWGSMQQTTLEFRRRYRSNDWPMMSLYSRRIGHLLAHGAKKWLDKEDYDMAVKHMSGRLTNNGTKKFSDYMKKKHSW